MWSVAVVFSSIIFFVATFKNSDEAKTYYFNQNKTTNQFLIYNRVNLNNSYYNGHANYENRPMPGELINKTKILQNVTKLEMNETYFHAELLDREWNYNWTNITRNKLPVYITKLYETVANDMKAPIKILFNYLPANSTTLKFNFTKFEDNITDVTLHIYHRIKDNDFQKQLIIRLYQIENSGEQINESFIINPDSHKLLNVIYLSQAETGWQVFKLNKIIKDWLLNQEQLLLFITISKPNEKEFRIFKDSEKGSLRTFIVVKMKDFNNDLYYQTNYTRIQNSPCRRQELQVDFEKLRWDKFIIAPKVYDAFTCVGRCFRRDNLTNHIKLASLNFGIRKKTFCCVPTHYAPLTIMFYNKFGNIEIKKYSDMIVSGCGCR